MIVNSSLVAGNLHDPIVILFLPAVREGDDLHGSFRLPSHTQSYVRCDVDKDRSVKTCQICPDSIPEIYSSTDPEMIQLLEMFLTQKKARQA